jgi:hypothetical protein
LIDNDKFYRTTTSLSYTHNNKKHIPSYLTHHHQSTTKHTNNTHTHKYTYVYALLTAELLPSKEQARERREKKKSLF